MTESALDSLDAQIAILGPDATILRVNKAWREFGAENGAETTEWVGWNYHDECARSAATGDEDAVAITVALAQVLRGGAEKREFAYECSSPTERRFFLMTIAAFEHDRERHATVVHEDVTPHVMRGEISLGLGATD
ncbi:MAG: PAS domain-containing protein [Actinomycetota bacterium]